VLHRFAILGSIARERGGTVMEHSDDLKDLTLRFYEAAASGDLSFFDRHVSRQEGVVFVGTDPKEWYEGFDALREAASREATRAQSETMGGMEIVARRLQAYQEGSVGWVIDRDASFRLPDGTEIPFRNTLVFRRENDEWKLVHGHSSMGVRNEEIFGEDRTA
jgi:ketosteroid isomerase-like protein